MKSKISCFNTAIFLKNIFLYWPLWASYLVIILGTIPGRLIYTLYHEKRQYPNGFSAMQNIVLLGQALDISWEMVIVFVAAVVTSMVLFYYLFQAKSANMIHAFPVTRGELYGTNLITGLLFLLGPQILSFFAGIFILLGFNVTCVEYFSEFMLLLIGITVLAYSIAVFCAMLTGQIVALPVFYLMVNVLYMVLESCIGSMLQYLGYGLVYNNSGGWKNWFSPALHLLERVKFYSRYRLDDTGSVVDSKLYVAGQLTVLGYLAVALALFVLAYLLYKNRNVECAGDLVAVPVLRPILRWGAGFGAGYLFVLVLVNIGNLVMEVPRAAIFIMVVVAGILFFIFAQMFITKNFKVFRTIRWKELAAFTAVMALSFLALMFCAKRMERYIPDEMDIKKVGFHGCMEYTFEGADIARIRSWQKAVVEHADELRSLNSIDNYCASFELEYELKNGKIIYRRYLIPITGVGVQMVQNAYDIEKEPQYFLQSSFGNRALDGNYFTQCSFTEYESDDSYREIRLTPEQTHVLEKAVIQDAQNGTLQKYNIWYYEYLDENASGAIPNGAQSLRSYVDFWMYPYTGLMEYYDTQSYHDSLGWVESEEWYDYTNYESFSFGTDCTNMVRALIELGIIDSVDDLL